MTLIGKARRRVAKPFHGGEKCYACDAKPVGLASPFPPSTEIACVRHRDPAIRTFDACIYCDEPVRKGSVTIDGQFAHAKCQTENSR